MAAINVVHDDEATRRRNIESWAAPSPSMNGQDYYTWAGVEYHPFGGRRPAAAIPQNEYERGYQAGYHAAMRRTARP
jgi:hypothetical protein